MLCLYCDSGLMSVVFAMHVELHCIQFGFCGGLCMSYDSVVVSVCVCVDLHVV